MKKRLLAMLLALMLVVSLLPVGVLAADYEVIIQAVVRNEDGGWASTNALTSKNFDGTTNGGTSGGSGSWQWTPSGGGYVLTAEFNSHANSWGNLMHPTDLWEYDQDELKFVGIGIYSYDTVNRYPTLTETILNSPYLFSRQSFGLTSSQGGGHHRTYIFERVPDQPDPPTNPTITGFTKERVITALTEETLPDDVEIELGDINVTYGNPVTIPNGGSVTLLYLLTVSGDPGANFTITDEDAELVGSNCGAALSDDGTITGTIPSGGEALIYVIKEFSSSDIKDGHLVNSATIQPGEDSELGDGVGTATDSTDASMEDPDPDPDPGDELKGTDVRVQVYVDGTAVKDPYTYVELERVSAESDSTGWKVALDSETGVITCDFDYEVGGYDCVDIGVALTTTALTGYDLQGVESYQSYGTSGTRNVTATSYGISYTIDNVTRSNDEQVDVKIYLRSTYVIQYTRDGSPYGDGGSDELIAGKDIEASSDTDDYPAINSSAWVSWANPNLSNTIILPALPTDVENVDGWFDIHNDKHAPNETYTVDADDAQYGIITLNATSTTEPPEPETRPVMLYIYKNGNTTEPVMSVKLDDVVVGETYDASGLDINDHYSSDYGFEFEGFYNDGGWNDYIGGNPDNTLDLSEPITVNDWYNIKCMVTDYEPVVVYGVTDGDKDNAVQLWSGKALHGSNLITFLDENEAGMNLDRTGYIRDQWYNWDWYGHKFAADTTVNGWTNVYVTYTSDWQPVHVVIYKNGNTSEPVVDVAIDSLLKGEKLDTTTLDISEYYTPDKFATGFDYEGWFNDGAWNNYKNAGCPEDAEGLDEIYINGWTNVIAMVWDQFPVNYHVLDESGEEVDSHSENRTVRDLNDDFWWPTVDAGYAFDGWYEKAEDIGNESKQEGLPLALKKYELYGELVSLAPEEGPNKDDLAQLKVLVKDNSGAINHGNETFGLVDDCYTTSGITETEGVYTYTITPTVAEYVKLYDSTKNFVEGSHTATTSQSKVHSFVFTWTDGEWVLTSDDSVTIGVKCSVTVPTPDELAELLQIRVKDYAGAEELPVGVTDHGQFVTGILEGTYSITGPTAENNTFVATVTLTDGSAYAAAYDENRQLEAGTHALTTTVSKLDPITLTYDFTTGTWSASNTGWSLGVKCEQVIYTIHVSFVGPNGEAYGGGDVISTMPDVSVEIADPVAEGKTFVGWKKLVGLEEIYTGEFTYTALAALVGDNFTPDTHETWLEFEAVFEDETVEPDPYNTIHVSFVGPNGEAYGGGDVISTMPDVSVEIADPVAEGKTFVGWKKLVGLEEIYTGEFTYTALAALVGDNFTPDTHEAWLTFEAVFEDETVEPDPYYIINIRFVDSDGTTSLGGGDVISTSPDAAYPSVPSPVAPQGMEFVGWKVWLGNEPMYEGKFTYNALKALREELDGEITWVDGRTWITFQAVYEDVTVEPDPDITDFSKTLLTDRDAYKFFDIAYPEFYHGDVVVDEGEGVTLIYRIVVEGTPGTAYTISDPGARLISNGSWTGTIDADGRVSILVAKTFSWRDVRNAGDTLDNTANVSVDGETVKTDTERVPVDIDWDINVPDIDDDDDDDVAEPDDEYIPNWLNTTDHYSYIVGYEDGTIRPGNNITRAEVATIFFRLLSEGSSERWYSASNSFSDVAADSWYNVPVSTLSNMGIIDGYEDGTFKPNAPITRAEFTAIATRFFDYTAEYEGAFNDVTYSDWYAECVQAAVDMGLVNGYADGGFHPNAYITRAESCAIVNRVLNRVPHEDYLLDEDEMITWPDNSYGAWYYADMQEATNSHDYDWISVSGEVVEEWTDKLTEPNW